MSRNSYSANWLDLQTNWPDCLDALGEIGCIFSFVCRPSFEINAATTNFLNCLAREDKLLRREKSLSWPGTALAGPEQATIFFSVFDAPARALLLEHSPQIGGWIHLEFFEDLAVYRSENMDLAFGSIIHEEDCFFELNEGEANAIQEIGVGLTQDG